jgi:hypothetical protein
MEQFLSKLRAEMKMAQAVQSEVANNFQRVSTILEDDNNIWLDTRNISTTQPSKRLDWKHMRQYKITKAISPWAYRITLHH